MGTMRTRLESAPRAESKVKCAWIRESVISQAVVFVGKFRVARVASNMSMLLLAEGPKYCAQFK